MKYFIALLIVIVGSLTATYIPVEWKYFYGFIVAITYAFIIWRKA